jgi:ubiquitin-like protein Pup
MGELVHRNYDEQGEEEQDTSPQGATVEIDLAEIDEVLGKIDEVLEENSAQFVANYRQQMGE